MTRLNKKAAIFVALFVVVTLSAVTACNLLAPAPLEKPQGTEKTSKVPPERGEVVPKIPPKLDETVVKGPNGLKIRYAENWRPAWLPKEVVQIYGGLRLRHDTIKALAFSPNGKRLVSGSAQAKTLKLWDVATGKELRTFVGHKHAIRAVAFSPDGRLLLSATHHAFSDGTKPAEIKLWHVATAREVRSFRGHKGPVDAICFSPDGKMAWSARKQSKKISLWDVVTGKLISTGNDLLDVEAGKALRKSQAREIHSAILDNGTKVIAAGRTFATDRILRLMDLKTGKDVWSRNI